MTTLPHFSINAPRLLAELLHLATITDAPPTPDPSLRDPQRAVTRIVFTPRDTEARTWLKSLATQAGFQVREDAAGNTFIRFEGSDPTLPAVGTGSHIDAIPHAGMYDGTVGVLGGLEALRSLKEDGYIPHRSLELLLFTSEEPTRFGIGCLGSRLLGGVLAPGTADALPDRLSESDPSAPTGGTLATVRQAAGFGGPLSSVPLAHSYYSAWLELHIEQGPSLERDAVDLGIVTAIAAPASYRFVVEGFGGHAGALLMPNRRDALCAASELILAIETRTLAANTRSGSPDTVATVGSLQVHPGNLNAVPSRVTLTLDIRDIDAVRRDSVMTGIRTDLDSIAARRGVRIREEFINADPPATCSPHLIAALENAASEEHATCRRMISRAYHDSSFMAQVCPVAMLFIPCREGVSHRPDEYASPESIALGTGVLARAMAHLSQQDIGTGYGAEEPGQ